MAKKKAALVNCPQCGKAFSPGRSMQHHLRDAHGITGMASHLIANPNDRQAAKTKTARKVKSAPKRPVLASDDDFDVIEPFSEAAQ